ncbi:MAG: hypothetical protein M3Z31_16995 [Pseudomonadota bacterium]|nr:hypothetical protein [Pseudomonadota bacterium]
MADHDVSARQDADADGALDYRGVGIGAAVIVVAIVLAVVSAFMLLRLMSGEHGEKGLAPIPGRAQGPAGGPALEVDPAKAIAAFRAEKERQLTSYGWIDRPNAIVHIPIERAMQIVAGQGTGEAKPK